MAKKPKPHWDLFRDGVTQSLLAKFVNDEQRFYIRYVKGLVQVDRKEAMDYGSIFHKLIETRAKHGEAASHPKMKKFIRDWVESKLRGADPMLGKIAMTQFEAYEKWASSLKKYKYVEQEVVFNEKFELPSTSFRTSDGSIRVDIPPGIEIPLRGRIDGIAMMDGGLWIVENKTKSRIDPLTIQDTIHKNIQVMFYALCLELAWKKPCMGVIYNVIRKPQLVQRTGRKDKSGKYVGRENDNQFLNRLREDILKHPDHYFMRFDYKFYPNAVYEWTRKTLVPYLYKIYIWWRSIEKNPTNPWEGNPINPFHAERPFGIFDPMSVGVGDYFRYITTGSTVGLVVSEDVFPELREDE